MPRMSKKRKHELSFYLNSVLLCGRFYMPVPWDNLSQGSQPRLPIPAVPPFCSPTHT